MKGMNTELSAFLEEKNFLPVGEQNPKIKQIKGILSNSKPNPQKLFVAEGIWILKMCEKFAAPVESLGQPAGFLCYCSMILRPPQGDAA